MSDAPGGTRRRVLYLTDSLKNGGAERQLTLLASSLPEGWSSRVVSIGDGPYHEVCVNAGIPLVVSERRFAQDPRPAGTIWREIRNWRPNIVHSWGWMSTLGALVPCRIHGIPLIDGTVRNGDRVGRRTGVQLFLMRRCDAVCANSLAGLRAYGFMPGKRGYVVYNGFDDTRLQTVPWCPPITDRVSVVMAARMVAEKDFQLLLTAAEILGTAEPDRWRFVLVGDGPMREFLMAEASRLKGCEVEFVSPGTEVLPIVAGADIGVLLTTAETHAEGCSNTILEYMASGLPVVCTDSGGNREVVREGVTGHLVPPTDTEAVSTVLRRLADNQLARRLMGDAARADLRARFSVEQMVSAYAEIYEGLMARRER